MELIKETKQVHLSTTSGAGRIINQDTNFKSQIEFNIPNLIRKEDDIEFIMFSVPYAVIPVSFYTINENNNLLDYLYNGNLFQIEFPQGNYNANQFISTFAIQKTAGQTLTLTLDPVTSRFSVTNTSGTITLKGTSTCDFIMGFSDDVVGTLVVNTVSTYKAVCPRCCNFLALPRINMRCNVLANSTMAGSQQTNDLVITIPNNSKPNGQIVYNNSSGIQMLFQQEILNSFVVSLTNDIGQLINFNGISSFWVFQFDIYRKKINKPQSFYNVLANVNKETLKKDLEQEQQ